MSAPQRPVSRLGFGVSGAHGTPLVRRADTVALIEQAVQLGVNVFDTAPAYGAGEAERRLGAALETLDRGQLHVMTKAGLISHGLAGRRRDFRPDAVEASLRASLRRLGVDGVDTFFLHGPDPSELTAVLFERLESLRRSGAFAALGVAGRGAELDQALQCGRFAALMAPVHPFLNEEEEARLRRAGEGGLTVFAIEAGGDGPAPVAAPRSPADLYKLARALRAAFSGPRSGRGRVGAEEGVERALARAGVDCVLSTTTRSEHLRRLAALGNMAPK